MKISAPPAVAILPSIIVVRGLRAFALVAALFVTLFATVPVAHAATGERVTFESLDIDPETAQPVTISALYFRPEINAANASNRIPAVVALHGCGGMYGTSPARRNRLTERHQAMADLLVAEGYAVLFPDSFNPRGRREVCSLKPKEQWITQDHRRLDVLAALTYLRARPDIDGEHVALLGWSHGGSAVLASMNRRNPVVAQFLVDQQPAEIFYRTAIALYPGCYESVRTRFGYAPAAPVSIFIGESDDWTSPKPCLALGARMTAGHEPLQVTTYADTYHGFDAPNMPRPMHMDVTSGVHPDEGVTIAANPAAREDAYRRALAQLRAALAP